MRATTTESVTDHTEKMGNGKIKIGQKSVRKYVLVHDHDYKIKKKRWFYSAEPRKGTGVYIYITGAQAAVLVER